MKIPARLVERIVENIIKELSDKHYVEAEDNEKFKKDLLEIINKAIAEEKEIEEQAEKLVEQHMHLIESEDIRYRTAVLKVKEKLAEERNIHLDPEERMNQVAHQIRKYIETDPTIEIFEHPNKIRRKVFEILKQLVKEEKEIDREVRQRIKSYSKKILEGTPEWRILYNRIYEDALKRRGLL
ncbi:MAG TPA: DUF507 domain-containing protein [Persephonella sp.]|uniref:DUF507 family protein n=1 Tax=Persephonella marina (strain DSM 14350 / EX-H1) TaxID=123214 RepID=C0QS25_PERMH|nr:MULTISPECIES: DUF507 family protein [Persephonella]ACO03702.1 conserved hypothetical protein [Persephonella marina EX-H1]HCB69216.1 DUF507 domain-containing protein [Persephonella sp.]